MDVTAAVPKSRRKRSSARARHGASGPTATRSARRFRFGPNREAPLAEVVGIVGDVRNDTARPDAEPMMYLSTRGPAPAIARFLIRSDGDPLALGEIRRARARRAEPRCGVRPRDAAARRRRPVARRPAASDVADHRIRCVGACFCPRSASTPCSRAWWRRAKERSPCASLSARGPRRSRGWCCGKAPAGWRRGSRAACSASSMSRGCCAMLLYGVSPFDPLVLGAAIATLAACATVALLLPLRRAMRVEPADVLRAQVDNRMKLNDLVLPSVADLPPLVNAAIRPTSLLLPSLCSTHGSLGIR